MSEEFDIRSEGEGSSDAEFENVLRPQGFDEFTGQQKVVAKQIEPPYRPY